MVRSTPTYTNLKILYDTINEIMGNKDIYYTPEEVEKLKNDTSNVFLIKEVENG